MTITSTTENNLPTLKLKVSPTNNEESSGTLSSPSRHIHWSEDTVDNENLNKKKSNCKSQSNLIITNPPLCASFSAFLFQYVAYFIQMNRMIMNVAIKKFQPIKTFTNFNLNTNQALINNFKCNILFFNPAITFKYWISARLQHNCVSHRSK